MGTIIVYRVTKYSENKSRYYSNLELANQVLDDLVGAGELVKVAMADLPLKEFVLACLNREGYAAYTELVKSKGS